MAAARQAELAALITQAQCRADRHRQRHRQPRDRKAGRRPDRQAAGTEADQGHRVGSRRLGLFRLASSRPRNSPISTCRCAAPSRSPAACRIRWPNWSRSSRSRSASASTSTMSTRPSRRARSMPWSKTAVNAVGVDLNTASAPLLARVSGLGRSLRQGIVSHRDEQRAVSDAQGSAEGAAPRRPHLRAMRRLPAHPRWQGAARCLLGAPGSLWRRQEDRRRLRPRPAHADGRQRGS